MVVCPWCDPGPGRVLAEGIEQLERQKEQLVAESSTYTLECQKLQQKLAIMTEMYHENELKLHR